jgi:hypothetical protein
VKPLLCYFFLFPYRLENVVGGDRCFPNRQATRLSFCDIDGKLSCEHLNEQAKPTPYLLVAKNFKNLNSSRIDSNNL